MKKVVFALAVALLVSLVCNYRSCTEKEPEVVIIERTDTLWMTKNIGENIMLKIQNLPMLPHLRNLSCLLWMKIKI